MRQIGLSPAGPTSEGPLMSTLAITACLLVVTAVATGSLIAPTDAFGVLTGRQLWKGSAGGHGTPLGKW